MTPTTRDMTVGETYTQCMVLSNRVFLVCRCHNADELNAKQNIPMCSSVWSRLSPVLSWKFACSLYPLQHDSTLKKTFHSKVVFRIEKWNGNEKPKKTSEKRELGKDKWYNQMGQVGTNWSTWDKWDKEKGVFRS